MGVFVCDSNFIDVNKFVGFKIFLQKTCLSFEDGERVITFGTIRAS
jgi:hypothetical protein